MCGRFAQTWLPTPYAETLDYHDEQDFSLQTQTGSPHPILRGQMPLLEHQNAFYTCPPPRCSWLMTCD